MLIIIIHIIIIFMIFSAMFLLLNAPLSICLIYRRLLDMEELAKVEASFHGEHSIVHRGWKVGQT